MTRADFLLVGICLVAAAALAVWFAVGKSDGWSLLVSCDGETMEISEFDERALQGGGRIYYLFLHGEGGSTWERFETYPEIPVGASYNLLSVSASDVSMAAADCRDQICVRHRPISGGGESIICLPHKLAVEIKGSVVKEESLDGMVN